MNVREKVKTQALDLPPVLADMDVHGLLRAFHELREMIHDNTPGLYSRAQKLGLAAGMSALIDYTVHRHRETVPSRVHFYMEYDNWKDIHNLD